MECVLALMGEHLFESGSAYHAFKYKRIKLAEKTYDAALCVGGAPLTQDLLALVGQLLGIQSRLLVL